MRGERGCSAGGSGRARRIRPAGVLLGLLLLAGCGGGSGSSGRTLPQSPLGPPGLRGFLNLPSHDLGEIAEQEVNDSADLASPIPPLWRGSRLRVSGTLAQSALAFGRVDGLDHLGLHALAAQDVAFSLAFEAGDRLDPMVSNVFRLEVLDADGIQVLASVEGDTSPLELTHFMAADSQCVLRVGIEGNGAWRLDLALADAAVSPPTPKPVADGPSDSAPRSSGPLPEKLARLPRAPAVCAPDRVLVALEGESRLSGLLASFDLRVDRRLGGGAWRLALASQEVGVDNALALAKRLAALPGVRWAEPDYVVHSLSTPAPDSKRQWNLRLVGASGAWGWTEGDPGIVVGVLDTGITAHPDFEGQVVPGYDFVADTGISGDGNGRDPDPTDPGDGIAVGGLSSWHGSHIAAVIAAKRDGQGVCGLAPGCRIMPLRVLGRGGGHVSDLVDAIDFAAGLHVTADGRRLDEPLPILNLSLGLSVSSSALQDACIRAQNAGVLLVAAAGNGKGSVTFPAAFESVLAVSAIDASLGTTTYSNFGEAVDLCAPGGQDEEDFDGDGWADGVFSAFVDETLFPAPFSAGAFVGTSQATPHVSATAALLLSLAPDLLASEVKDLLVGSALDLGVLGHDQVYGWGLVRADEALRVLAFSRGLVDARPPRLTLPLQSVRFESLATTKLVPLSNGGSGRLELGSPSVSTFDGAPWLEGTLIPSATPGLPISHTWLRVEVILSQLPPATGQACGQVILRDVSGVALGSLQVVAYVRTFARAGEHLQTVAFSSILGGAASQMEARPEFGYRFWLRDLEDQSYRLRGGEDLDRDGVFCELGDSCGYYGGPTIGQAVSVPHDPGAPAPEPLEIVLSPSFGP